MNDMPKFDRRSFLIGAAATGGGFSLGFNAFGDTAAQAADATPEVNAWVVIKPDDSVVIRVVRPDMGQGSRTGLAQMVVEELECDWNKVSTEYPTPGQNLARKRVWGAMNSTGSQAIRQSNEYVRKGGAAARMMLLQAAANDWKVPVEELTVANGVITHAKSKRKTTYGKVADAAAKLERKGCDLLVVNDVSAPSVGFDHDTNAVHILSQDGTAVSVDLASKRAVADRILDRVSDHLNHSEEKDNR